ncbi:MAG TPA: beta-propeller domain-containing protein [Acidimicrobiales bacterium]|nr:beta-propeller domain-containing protein [Acidimicrobiales bacterium]
MRMARTAFCLATVGLIAGCSVPASRGLGPPTTSTTVPSRPVPTTAPARAALVSLVHYDSCTGFLDQVRGEALAEVGATGLPTESLYAGGPVAVSGGARFAPMGAAAPMAASSGSAAAAPAAGAGAGAPAASSAPDQGAGAPYSATNNQEAGVDEPDLAKTDGRVLATVVGGSRLEVVDVGVRPPRLAASVSVDGQWSPSLFLVGHDAVLIGQKQAYAVPAPVPEQAPPSGPSGTPAPPALVPAEPPSSRTAVTVVDLSDPYHPRVTRSFSLDGTLVDSRVVAGRLEVVLDGQPRLPFVYPSGPGSQGAALAANRAAVAASTVADWLPSVTNDRTGVRTTASCALAMHPTVASGLDTVSLVSLDPDSDQAGAEVTVMGDAATVYASVQSVYVATQTWADQQRMAYTPDPTGVTTDIHQFDISDPAHPRYAASGAVAGSLIDQYSLSEYQGDLRVASTVGQATPAPGEGQAPATLSDNMVTVLHAAGGVLAPVGTVSDLGAGQRIYGVRFLGDVGYVVTFRQIDPLYVVDLSDPRAPRVQGQLEVSGYSSVLQPVGADALLGVGQAVDANAHPTGLQISLFDVSRPTSPKLASRLVLDGANSPAQSDHHALLYWPAANLVVLPVTEPGGSTWFDGAIAFHLRPGDSLAEVGRVSHQGHQPSPPPGSASAGRAAAVGAPAMVPCCGTGIQRALVAGDLLYTVSNAGVLASDLHSFSDVAWLPFD